MKTPEKNVGGRPRGPERFQIGVRVLSETLEKMDAIREVTGESFGALVDRLVSRAGVPTKPLTLKK